MWPGAGYTLIQLCFSILIFISLQQILWSFKPFFDLMHNDDIFHNSAQYTVSSLPLFVLSFG